jgi:ech hydrogenase subunit D
MVENQPVTAIQRAQLVAKTDELRGNGYRLVQICCTLGEDFEITYSFDKEYSFVNLRLHVAKSDPVLPSITEVYLAAFTYENELQDLFGLTVTGLAVNYNGKFYRTSVKTPFAMPRETATK